MTLPKLEMVIVSDLHAHNFKYGAKRVPHPSASVYGNYNSRLLDCVQVLQDVGTYCFENNITTVLFGGDLFHRRSVIHTDAYNLVHRELEKLSMYNINLFMIPGNHDYGDRSGFVHSLAPLAALDHIEVMDTVSCTGLGSGVELITVPYTDDLSKAKEWLAKAGELAEGYPIAILLAHLGMKGARVGSDYVLVSDGDIDVADVPHEKFTACFFGHYHQHQQLFQNGWFIGAALQHNWGDSGSTRGFLHARVFDDRVTFEQVETSAPRFLRVDSGTSDSTIIRPVDFVQYTLQPGECPTDEVEQRMCGAHLEFKQVADSSEDRDLTLPAGALDPANLVEFWVDNEGEGESATFLKALGKSLIAEAKGQVL